MLTALYDGNCALCRASCASLRRLDWRKRIEFIDLHESERWRTRLPGLPLESLLGEIHVIDGAGALYSGFQASRRLLKELPLGWLLWLLLRLPGMDSLGSRGYRFIARRRYRLSRLLGMPPACVDERCASPVEGSA